MYRPAAGRVLARVGEQVREDLLNAIGVGERCRQIRRHVQGHGVAGVVAGDLAREAQQRREIRLSEPQPGGARLHALQVQQLIDEARDADTLIAHCLEVLTLPVRRPVVSQQELRESDKRGNEVLDLVPEDRERIRGLHR